MRIDGHLLVVARVSLRELSHVRVVFSDWNIDHFLNRHGLPKRLYLFVIGSQDVEVVALINQDQLLLRVPLILTRVEFEDRTAWLVRLVLLERAIVELDVEPAKLMTALLV